MLQGTNATQIATIDACKEIDDTYETCKQIIKLIKHQVRGNSANNN